MRCKKFFAEIVFVAVLSVPAAVWAGHPLITDDTGTQGKGKFQLEVNGQYDYDKETVDGVSVKTTGGQMAGTLSYGIIDNMDIVLSAPYAWNKVKEDGTTVSNEKGISDTSLDVKWRFFEKDGVSLALKPGLSFPTGNDEKGLGAGKTGYRVFLIGSKEAAPWAFHANIGYIRNRNTVDELHDIWHASVAATYEVIKNLKLAGNIGIERNPDKASNSDPAFILGGIIYSVSENFDIDFGVKGGLNEAETDVSFLAGITLRF